MARILLLLGSALIFATGCDTGERLAKLEKQNQELQADLKKRDTVEEYDLQEKCARSAKVWFSENWGSSGADKDTILLDRSNHHNRANNKCFVLVEYHYTTDRVTGSWVNHISLWDANENVKYGEVSDYQTVYTKPEFHVENKVMYCELSGSKCKSVDEFNNLARPYMNN